MMLLSGACFFYLFCLLCRGCGGFMVISARNPVHSVLFLILAFFNAAGLFMLLGAEFLAMILLVVYVGAVAVLFLFVVMMLDVDFAELREGFLQYLPIGALVGLVLLVELVWCSAAGAFAPSIAAASAATPPPRRASPTPQRSARSSTPSYVFYFQMAGLVLLSP